MALVITIAGVDRTSLVRPGTLQIPDRLNERSEASFDLAVTAGGYHPQPYDAVTIALDGTTIFEGFIWDPEESLIVEAAGRNALDISVKCVDLHLLADRRIVAESYDDQTASYIVNDLITKYLAGDGVTAGIVQTGPAITRAVFNYVPLAQAMDELAELAGFYWLLKPGKKLDFADRSTNLAPWSVTSTSDVRGVKVRRHREEYRNRQYIRAGHDITTARTERFKGNGENKAFTLVFPAAKVPTVKVNAVTKTVGIRGVDSGKDWYWNKGDPVINQDDAGTALASTDTLEVTYQGLFPIVVVAESGSDITDRKATESTAGIYEAVDEAANLDNADAAMEVANAKLSRYARLSTEVTFNTDTSGVKAGQLVTIDISAFNLNAQCLIQEVSFVDIGLASAGRYRYQVKALNGSAVGSWVTFFKRLTQQGRKFVIRDNEVLVKLKRMTDGVKIGDTLTIAKVAPVSDVGTAEVGFSEVA